MFASPESSYVDILTLKGDGIRRWGLWKGLGHEGGVLMGGISARIEETPEESPCPFCHVRT